MGKNNPICIIILKVGVKMSLKGYEWLKDNKVIMYYTFKYNEITLINNVTKQDLQDFNKWLNQNYHHSSKVNYNGYKVIESEC